MKNFFLFLLVTFFVSYCVSVKGQTITDIQTPVSPGFVLADQTPSSVNRPSNTKSLVASFLSLNRGGALEVAPYWIIRSSSRDKLTYEDYIKTKVPFLQTLSFSITSFKSDTGSYLSAGFRFVPLKIYGSITRTAISTKVATLVGLLSTIPLDTAAISKARKELKEIDNRPILVVEIAAATLGYSPDNGYDRLNRSRTGIWANAAFKPSPSTNLIALIRYINNAQQERFSESSKMFDLGASFGIENKQKTFSLNAEYVYRNNYLTEVKSHRVVAVANYKFTDQIYFVGSFGKNFAKVDNIVALFGINFGLSSNTLKLN